MSLAPAQAAYAQAQHALKALWPELEFAGRLIDLRREHGDLDTEAWGDAHAELEAVIGYTEAREAYDTALDDLIGWGRGVVALMWPRYAARFRGASQAEVLAQLSDRGRWGGLAQILLRLPAP
ncbi:hypothetical protein [Deinococcus rufus]|uniref:Uncharacterized protein n=1 Tax=Deinococcus rufus TaxID=2136097 RepID=A0ABV7Z7K5_9DEIO